MPEKSFALEPGGAERLVVSWVGGFGQLAVAFDGQPVASFDSAKELKDARVVALPDGSRLEVQLASPLGFPELRLRRDGEPVPGSSGDPVVRHKAAWGVVTFVAGFNVLLGLLALILDSAALKGIGLGWGSLLSGLLYGALAVFIRGRSAIALGLAAALFVLDGLVVMASATQPASAIGGLLVRVFLLVVMLRGFPAIRELERPRRRVPPRRAAPPAKAAGSGPAAATAVDAAAGPSATEAGAGATPASRTLSGDAERRRLQMGAAAAPSTRTGPSHSRRSISMRGGSVGVDEAAASLRFVARRCEIGPDGLRAYEANGKLRDLAWSEIARIVVRALPPDPPWDAGLVVDLVAPLDGRWQPVRIFGATFVNYAALPGGASAARLDNVRRLAGHVRERNPALAVDEETAAFLAGGPAPRFPDITGFAEYDAAYG